MKKLSIIILSDIVNETLREDEYDILFSDEENILNKIKEVNSRYIVFSKDGDNVANNYLEILLKKCNEKFDCCFINYNVQYDYKSDVKILKNEKELKNNKPYFGSYIWSFIFDKKKLLEMLGCNEVSFNDKVNEVFEITTAIGDVIYTHNPKERKVLNNFCYSDIRDYKYYKNVIYVGGGCNGTFNGYISWIKNIAYCFSDKYDITILYDALPDITKNVFEKYFTCVKFDNKINYCCDRLLVTYSNYFYPKNIFVLDENYMFIHGNMSDYPNTMHYYDDIYTKYIGVSKVAAEKAKGYFPTNNIEYIYNPFKLDNSLLKPHLKLTSAQRHSDIKRPERIEIVADVLKELGIPFTWNVFTDKNENTNKDGVIYRRRVSNPLPYIQDSDYFVLLSDSEALGYCVLEALSLNTKVLVTPLEAFDELGVIDGKNGFIIPFEYFNPENKAKLAEILLKAYKEKTKEFDYSFDEEKFKGYHDLFI